MPTCQSRPAAPPCPQDRRRRCPAASGGGTATAPADQSSHSSPAAPPTASPAMCIKMASASCQLHLSSCTSRVASLSGAAIMARRSSSCGVGTCHKMHHRVAIDSGGLPMETPGTMRHSRCTQRSFSRALLAQECAVQGGPLMKITDSTHDALFYIL